MGLGYPGGRTGWFANYAKNDALRGIRGVGQTNQVNQAGNQAGNQAANPVPNAPYNYGKRAKQMEMTTIVMTGLGLVGSLYLLAEYRGRNKLLKGLKKVTRPVNQPVQQGVNAVRGN